MSTEFFKAAAFALVTSASIAQADEDITYAMTTTQEASGFASALLKEMKAAFPSHDLSYSVSGTSQQLRSLQDGILPFGITHNPVKEKELVYLGAHSSEILFTNDFLFVGPPNSPITCSAISDCLKALVDSDQTFLSRGDRSGTHAYEMAQWSAISTDPVLMPNYQVSSGGAANSLRICGIQKCHLIVDESSFSTKQRNGLIEIARASGSNAYSLIYSNKFAEGTGKEILLWIAEEAPKLSEKFGYRQP